MHTYIHTYFFGRFIPVHTPMHTSTGLFRLVVCIQRIPLAGPHGLDDIIEQNHGDHDVSYKVVPPSDVS